MTLAAILAAAAALLLLGYAIGAGWIGKLIRWFPSSSPAEANRSRYFYGLMAAWALGGFYQLLSPETWGSAYRFLGTFVCIALLWAICALVDRRNRRAA